MILSLSILSRTAFRRQAAACGEQGPAARKETTIVRTYRLAALAALVLLVPMLAQAHHGWRWTTGGNIELTGIIEEAKLGNPHGILTVDADGESWTVEVGQPWRNDRAGLEDGDLAPGVEIRAIGEPAAEPEERRLKVERLFIGDREYVLYPNRD
jgi:hypothetical protein